MAKVSIKRRVSEIEGVLLGQFDRACTDFCNWLDTQPKNEERAFWRVLYDHIKTEREPTPQAKQILCGGLDLQPGDLELADALVGKVPPLILKRLKSSPYQKRGH